MTEVMAGSQLQISPLSVLLALLILQFGLLPNTSYSKSSPLPPVAIIQVADKGKAAPKEKQQEFETYMRNQLHILESKIEALREKGTDLRENTKSQFNNKFEKLKEQQDAIMLKIEKLRYSSEHAWEDMKQGIYKKMNDLQQSLPKNQQTK